MKWSAYNLVTSVGDDVLVSNLLSRSVLRIPSEVFSRVQALTADTRLDSLDAEMHALIHRLGNDLFLLPDEFNEWEYVRKQHVMERARKNVKTVVLAPTMGCNMACHYCYEKKHDGQIADDVVVALEKELARSLPGHERLHIQWFGGEPLMALEKIDDISTRLRRIALSARAEYSAEVITNGHYLDEAAARLLKNHGVNRVQITFEGMRRLHDRVRFDPSHGDSTFDRLVKNIMVASAHLPITARVHVAPYNMDSVLELLQHLADEGLNSRLKNIYFSPLFNYVVATPGKKTFPIEVRKFMSASEFAESQVKLVEHSIDLGFNVGDFLDVSYGLCMAMQSGSIVVSPNGLLSKCYLDIDRPESAHGTLAGASFEGSERDWLEYDFSVDQECRECTFAPVCLGGCPKQKMNGADKRVVCTPLRFNFHARMRLQHGNAGGALEVQDIAEQRVS